MGFADQPKMDGQTVVVTPCLETYVCCVTGDCLGVYWLALVE